jgi:hypothetical protein
MYFVAMMLVFMPLQLLPMLIIKMLVGRQKESRAGNGPGSQDALAASPRTREGVCVRVCMCVCKCMRVRISIVGVNVATSTCVCVYVYVCVCRCWTRLARRACCKSENRRRCVCDCVFVSVYV